MNTSKKYIYNIKNKYVLNILVEINQSERQKYFLQKPVNSFSKT